VLRGDVGSQKRSAGVISLVEILEAISRRQRPLVSLSFGLAQATITLADPDGKRGEGRVSERATGLEPAISTLAR
jgi:hypothetical protein